MEENEFEQYSNDIDELISDIKEYQEKQDQTAKDEEEKINLKHDKRKKLLRNIRILSIKIVFVVIFFYIILFKVFGFTRMNDLAMHPTIAAGDLLLYYRLDNNYHIGDVVTFKKNNKRYVLRIIATEGQVVSLNGNNELYNNSGNYDLKQTLFEDLIPEESKIEYPYTVGKGKVFVVGDYRLEADDSRVFGAIDTKIIDGKVISLIQTKDI